MPYIGFAFTDCALDFLESLPPKIRRQVGKRAKALHTTPFPASAKKLKDVETPDGDPVYRERSGDYRILYAVRTKPDLILILDIDHRKDVYRMPKTNTDAAEDMRMKEADFDDIMGKALGVPAPIANAKNDDEPKRLSAHPRKKG